jgi:uncharacterized membrane protein YbhN (UPF0104 family)
VRAGDILALVSGSDRTAQHARPEFVADSLSRGELAPQPDVGGRGLRERLIVLVLLVLVVAGVILAVPGLASLRTRIADGDPAWLGVGAVLKVLSGLSYVAVFRSVFCRRMSWRLSTEIGLSELGANAVVPTGGAGGLALGAWALRRGGMDVDRIARRSVAFFLLTSVPNVLGVIVIGFGLATGLLGGHVGIALTAGPALIALAAIALAIASGRWAGAAQTRLARTRGERSRLARLLGAVSEGVEESLGLLRERDPLLLCGLAGYLAFDVMILWATFQAFGNAPPLAILWIGYLIGELGGLIPIPGGLGGVDLGLVGTLVLYKVPVGAATAAVLGYRAIALVVPAVLGGVALIRLRRSLAREQLAVSNCGPDEQVEIIGHGRVRITA